MDRDRVQRIPLLGRPLSFVTQNAIYSGDYLEKWMNELLRAKGIVYFRDIMKDDYCPLKIIASDITKRNLIVLPDDLIKYNIAPGSFPIAKAVRMSISIPFYFKPVKLKYRTGCSYIVDGCITCNYPINIFDDDMDFPTIGFKFDDGKESYTSMGKVDPLSFLFDVASTMANKNNVQYLSEKNKKRSIIIPTAGVETTDFNISQEQSHQLFKYGYRSAVEFTKEWNYEAFKENYLNVD
jgi:predicted acylesterase/phospholipase RssA